MSYQVKLRGVTYNATSLQAASDLFAANQDFNDIRRPIIRQANVTQDGVTVARISQNGNVWPRQEWFWGMEPLYRRI